jgi:hypothetical protein
MKTKKYTHAELCSMKTLKLTVQKKHTKGAKREDCELCPAARAAKEIYADIAPSDVAVIGAVRFGNWSEDFPTVHFQSKKLKKAIHKFDRGGEFPVGTYVLRRETSDGFDGL